MNNFKLFKPGRHSRRTKSTLIIVLYILIAVSLACSLPGLDGWGDRTGTPNQNLVTIPETPPPPPTSLPPALVETDPAPGSEIGLAEPITLYFNQPMEPGSVEGALSGQPTLSGRFSWPQENVLTFTPDAPFLPGTDLILSINNSARSKGGMTLLNPMEVAYRTVGYLRMTEALPAPHTVDVNPTSAVVVSFNRAVISLGARSDQYPPAFSLEPEAPGVGEWANTSTYIFYPQPALAGGKTYTVHLSPELKSVDGSPLELDPSTGQDGSSWSFTTSLPVLLGINTSEEVGDSNFGVGLQPKIVLTFNQPMNPESMAESFSLTSPGDDPVEVEMTTDETGSVFTFVPVNILNRNVRYTARLSGQAHDQGGTPLGSSSAASFTTVSTLKVNYSEPIEGGIKPVYESVVLHFSAHLDPNQITPHIRISPEISNFNTYLADDHKTLYVYGDFAPATNYTIALSPELPDAWNDRIEVPFFLNFRTAALDPQLIFTSSMDAVFLRPEDTYFPAQATNISNINYVLGAVPLDDLMLMLGENGYDIRHTYQPRGARVLGQSFNLTPNTSQAVDINLSPDGSPLIPGIYYLRVNIGMGANSPTPQLVVSSNLQVTIKVGPTDVLVWVVDLRTNQAVYDAPVTIYSDKGFPLVSGRTDAEGIFHSEIPPQEDLYNVYYAVVANPGMDLFGMGLSTWEQGLSPWFFDIFVDYAQETEKVYFYTDRPIYRPGQTVNFRAIVRQNDLGQYSLSEKSNLIVSLYDFQGEAVNQLDLPLSAYGTAHGQFELPPEIEPGLYWLSSSDLFRHNVFFEVTDYRKPEIDLEVYFDEESVQAGEELVGQVNANYFFGAPASNLKLEWALYSTALPFSLPGYMTGNRDFNWMFAFPDDNLGGPLGMLIAEGNAQTRPDGSLTLRLPNPIFEREVAYRRLYTLEVTVRDESDQPVSSRASVDVHPADYYIGIAPDNVVTQVGGEFGFEIITVDEGGIPDGERRLRASFSKIEWVREEIEDFGYPVFKPILSQVGSTSFVTGPDGLARISFIPPEPGTYLLDVIGINQNFDGAVSQVLVWAIGPGQAVWPPTPNQRLTLTNDKVTYLPGDTAQVFIPNPFGTEALALITIERGSILRHQLVTIDETGYQAQVPLLEGDIPNIYFSVTVISQSAEGRSDFRYGLINLPVEPLMQTLNVDIIRETQGEIGPRDSVNFRIKVTDVNGQPVQGEFSLSLVDKAVLSLADANAPEIMDSFYGNQPLGIRTGISLAAEAYRSVSIPPGRGGGGGGEGVVSPTIREEFPDTAFWKADVVTDANGEAQITVVLPDNLTTWMVDTRGITADSKVGQNSAELVTSKDLMVRPVTPRFFVVGDHLQLTAVVHNNTSSDLQAEVSLQAVGFKLDEEYPAVQVVRVAAEGRTRVEWWGQVQNVDQVDLVFSASSGSLHDSTRPPLGGAHLPSGLRLGSGALPVLRYTAGQSFSTSGFLDKAEERLELVSIPTRLDLNPEYLQGGELRVELAPTLAAAILESLDVLERSPYENNEGTLSRFLPNLDAYHALQALNVHSPELESRLERTLNESVARLQARQNADGGWGWWPSPSFDSNSDPYITAYLLFGLYRARELGISINNDVIASASNYLSASLPALNRITDGWMLDRLAFMHFSLAYTGAGDISGLESLYDQRSQLSPWAQALLALSFEIIQTGEVGLSDQASTLFSDLQSSAIRTSTGVHWQSKVSQSLNPGTQVFTTAVVVFALAQRDPALPILGDALRFMMAHRSANVGWGSTYENAWALMAAIEVLKGTGEWGGNFSYSAALNGIAFAQGQAGGNGVDTAPLIATLPLSSLHPTDPNALTIKRSAGPGRLYYRAYLTINQPVETAKAQNRGFSISRDYQSSASAVWVPSEAVEVGDMLNVWVTLVVPEDAYYVIVEDFIPAGTEILHASLKTSALGKTGEQPLYNPAHPFDDGWGWWYFASPKMYDDRILWTADFLPAGTYVLTYQLTGLQPGRYNVLPVHAWQFYFPEVRGASAGTVFEVLVDH
jgi:alpha-2-macroglobulin